MCVCVCECVHGMSIWGGYMRNVHMFRRFTQINGLTHLKMHSYGWCNMFYAWLTLLQMRICICAFIHTRMHHVMRHVSSPVSLAYAHSYTFERMMWCVMSLRVTYSFAYAHLHLRIYTHMHAPCDESCLITSLSRICAFTHIWVLHVTRHVSKRDHSWLTLLHMRIHPSKHLVQILRGGSSYPRFLMREHSK